MKLDSLGRRNPQVGRVAHYTHRLEVYLSPTDLSELTAFAKRTKQTRSEVIRTALTWLYETERKSNRSRDSS